eukprot:scaffold7405_cov204-Amphora_coffeaeformis.AAC.4
MTDPDKAGLSALGFHTSRTKVQRDCGAGVPSIQSIAWSPKHPECVSKPRSEHKKTSLLIKCSSTGEKRGDRDTRLSSVKQIGAPSVGVVVALLFSLVVSAPPPLLIRFRSWIMGETYNLLGRC